MLVVAPRTSATSSSPAGVIVPLYESPDSDWTTLIQMRQAYPNVPLMAIISGPGGSFSSTFLSSIQSLQSAGITVLGYVWTGYGSVSVSSVESSSNTWFSWYNVNGIFFDGMSAQAGYATYYSTLTSFVHSLGMTLTVGNPGTAVPTSLIGTVDIICVWENGGYPSLSYITYPGYPASDFYVIPYGVSLNTSWLQQASSLVSWFYITDDTGSQGPCYCKLPSYFTSEVAAISSIDTGTSPPPAQTVAVTINSADLTGNAFGGVLTTVQSGGSTITTAYTPLTFYATVGAQYVVTVSNYQNASFSHWSDGTTDPSITISPTQATTLTAYYSTSSVNSSSATPTLDGSVSGQGLPGTVTASLTTSHSPDIVYVIVAAAGATPNIPTASGLTFTLRKSTTAPSGPTVSTFYAIANSPLSSESITATAGGSTTEIQIIAFGISGAEASAPFDTNVAVPSSASGSSVIASVTISTNNANDFVIGAEADSQGASGGGAGTGFALLYNVVASDGANDAGVEYTTVSAAQTNLAVAYNQPVSDNWAIIADAVVADPVTSTASVTVKSVWLNGSSLTGMLTQVRDSSGTSIATGNTPFSFNAIVGSEYVVSVSNNGNTTFQHWGDGTTNSSITIVPTQDPTLTAYYSASSTSSNDPPTVLLNIDSVNLAGTQFSGMWIEIATGGQVVDTGYTSLTFNATAGVTYSVAVSNYGNYLFNHWAGGSTDSNVTITPSQATTLTAYYDTPVTIKVRSVDLAGNVFSGMWTTIQNSAGNTLATGYTTLSFNGEWGQTYVVCVSNYQQYIFAHWGNGDTNSCKTVTPSSNIVMTAYYDTPITITIRSVDLSGTQFSGMWTTIQSSNGTALSSGYTTFKFATESGQTYTICVSNYQNYVFQNWANGNTNSCRTIAPLQSTTYTAVYNTTASSSVLAQSQLSAIEGAMGGFFSTVLAYPFEVLGSLALLVSVLAVVSRRTR
jgi:Spherulation-specific family 4